MHKLKIIIIGAGPAGLEAARVLEAHGIIPTIIEKRPLPQDKPCAGGVTKISVNNNPVRRNRVVYEDKSFEVMNTIWMISRKKLSEIQLEKLKSTRILKETAVEIHRSSVRTNLDTHPFDFLIGADGATSIVRRHLKLKNKFTMALYQETQEALAASEWHIHPQFGYLWKFPKKDRCNTGIYFDPNHLTGKKAVALLKATTNSNARIRGGPIQYHYQGYRFGNIFLAGEAAGFTSRITGEGIYHAITTGRCVAEKIINPNAKNHEIHRLIINKYFQELIFYFIKYFPSTAFKLLKLNRSNPAVIGTI
jgi:flavin-dependent dehydrogenase